MKRSSHIHLFKKLLVGIILVVMILVAGGAWIFNHSYQDKAYILSITNPTCTEDVPPSSCSSITVKTRLQAGRINIYTLKGYDSPDERKSFEENNATLQAAMENKNLVRLTLKDSLTIISVDSIN